MAKFNWKKHRINDGWSTIIKQATDNIWQQAILGQWRRDGSGIAIDQRTNQNTEHTREERQAVAPGWSCRTISGSISPGIEPQISNVYRGRDDASQSPGSDRIAFVAGRRAGKSMFTASLITNAVVEQLINPSRASSDSFIRSMVEQVVFDEFREGIDSIFNSEESQTRS